MNKICVYAITKNEEQFVDRWYESMKEADCIVVLDTGSTDNTVQKLKDHGVYVETKTYDPWRFDTPRNDAMDLVPEDCNILLSTDLDEVLEPGWSSPLREKWIEGVHQRAQYKYVWSHDEFGNNGRVFRYNKIHTRDWRWKYPVHELLCNTNTHSELYNHNEELDLFNEITLHHYPDQSKSRGNYLPLLELREQENKEDWYGLIYLAHEYCYRGFYQKSIDKLNYILNNYKDNYNAIEQASCYLFMGDDYVALGDKQNAIDSYIKAIESDETYREAYIALAKVYNSINRFKLSEAILKKALTKTYRHYTWLEKDTSWTYELYDILSLACYYNNNKKDSILYAYLALNARPEDERLKNNLKLCVENTKDSELK